MARREGTIVTRYVGDGTHLLRTTRQVRGALLGVTREVDRTNARMAQLSKALNTAFKVSAITGSIYALTRALRVIVDNAGEFEYALAGIAKTTDLSNPAVERLGRTLLAASINMGQARIEMLEVAKVAGQLGIHGQRDLAKFTIAITKLSGASNLAAEEGATHLARFLYLTNNTPQAAERVASAIVHLGNNVAATESEILRMATAMSQTTASLSLSDTFISGWAATVAAAGLRVESTSNATFRFMEGIQVASRESGVALEKLAEAIDMPLAKTKEFIDQDLEGFVRSLIVNLANFDPAAITSLLYSIGIDDIRTHRSINTTIQQERATGAFSRNIALAESQSLQGEALNREFQRKRETLIHDIESVNQRMGAAFERISSVIVEKLLPAYDRMAVALETISKFAGSIAGVLSLLLTVPVLGGATGAIAGFRAYRTLRYGTAAARKDRRIRKAENPDYVGRPEDADSFDAGLDQRRASLDHFVPLARRGIAQRLIKNPEKVEQLERDMAALIRYEKQTRFSIGKQRVLGERNIIKQGGLGALLGGGTAAGLGAFQSSGADSVASRRNLLYGEESPLRFTAFKDDESYGKFILALSDDADVRKKFTEEMDALIVRMEKLNEGGGNGFWANIERLLNIEDERQAFSDARYDPNVSSGTLPRTRQSDGTITLDERAPTLEGFADAVYRPDRPSPLFSPAESQALKSFFEQRYAGGQTSVPPTPGLFGVEGNSVAEADASKGIFQKTVEGVVSIFANQIGKATDTLNQDFARGFKKEQDSLDVLRHRRLLSVGQSRRTLLNDRGASQEERTHRTAMLALTERQVNAEVDLSKARSDVARLSLIKHADGSPGAKDLREAQQQVETLSLLVGHLTDEQRIAQDVYDTNVKRQKVLKEIAAIENSMAEAQKVAANKTKRENEANYAYLAELENSIARVNEGLDTRTYNEARLNDLLAERAREQREAEEKAAVARQEAAERYKDTLDEIHTRVLRTANALNETVVNPLRELIKGGSASDGFHAVRNNLADSLMEEWFIRPATEFLAPTFENLAADLLGIDSQKKNELGIQAQNAIISIDAAGAQVNMEGLEKAFDAVGLNQRSIAHQFSGIGSGGGSGVGKTIADTGKKYVANKAIEFAASFFGLADGGVARSGGLAVVGERGAEVVRLPTGAAVYPNGSIPADMGGVHVTNQIVVEGVQDPDIVENQVRAMFPEISDMTKAAVGGDLAKPYSPLGRAARV